MISMDITNLHYEDLLKLQSSVSAELEKRETSQGLDGAKHWCRRVMDEGRLGRPIAARILQEFGKAPTLAEVSDENLPTVIAVCKILIDVTCL